MALLMTLGILGTLGYIGYFAKQETKAIIGDNTIKPTYSLISDKRLIDKHFKLICKRCDVKLDGYGNPIHKNHYKPCIAYLLYQGFQEPATEYFKETYLQKYNKKERKKIEDITTKHNDLLTEVMLSPHKNKTKIVRKWYYGSKKSIEDKCYKITENALWNMMVCHWNIVKDGSKYVVIWTVQAPPEVLKQIDKIYEEVCYIQGI